MKLQPLSNRVFIEQEEAQSQTASGIIIPPTSSQEKPFLGKVIATGPGKVDQNGKIVKMSVKPGDTVLFRKYGPDEIEIEGKTYLVASEDDILAVLYK